MVLVMSELFKYKGDDEHYFIKTKNKHYTGDEVVALLNEQQSIIKAKDEEILKLKKDIIILQKRIELYKKL